MSENELIAAVDALLAAQPVLPPPPERERLRRAHGLTQADVAAALEVRRATVVAWEAGRSEPRGDQRTAYAHLLERLAALYPAPDTLDTPAAAPAEAAPPASPAPASSVPTSPAAPAAAPPRATSRKPTRRRAAPAATPAPEPPPAADAGVAGAGAAYPAGPLAVVGGAGTAHLSGGRWLHCPAATLPALADWALGAGLGAPRLHRHGRDADPLLVLTAEAAERYGLPGRLADRRGLRLPDDHPVVRDLTAAGWQLTRRGLGPWSRVYRPVRAGRRQCVQLAVLPWDALDERAWPGAAALPAPALADMLGTYAQRVITPRGSAATTGLELMTALRPPTRPARTEDGSGWTSGDVPGSLAYAVDPAPPEAPPEHPVAAGRGEGPAHELAEEAYEWVRSPELLDDAECALTHAVGLDINAAFLAASSRLTVGLGPAVHTDGPRFDARVPGSWLVDLSGIETDPRLPSPFTPDGTRPTGPAWYATPTLAYAAELGADVRPLEGWLRPDSGPYLDPWYTRLRAAYLATYADLGVTPGMPPADYLAAMDALSAADPAVRAVLAAVKATAKGGIGKLRQRPQGGGYRPGTPWPALERPTWRPDIRAAVIATARTAMHRKMRRMAAGGFYPLAVLSDCVVYPAPDSSPLSLMPRTADGAVAAGPFRLGVSPGMAKLEGAKPLVWAVELMDQGHNPARHIKGD
ncbi:telomere-associated protein Tap [Streptomyces sp. NPDC049879]|uniref:telomere-associated protein Tap n=1 Tax=Streptomyces sp. NPDC049879 TaxID=3365598 RepID=UPI0037AEE878